MAQDSETVNIRMVLEIYNMNITLNEAIRSMVGTSSLADSLIERNNLNSEQQAPDTSMKSESSSEVEADMSSLITGVLSDIGDVETSDLPSTNKVAKVIIHLLETVDDLRSEVEELRGQLSTYTSSESTPEEVESFKKKFKQSISNRRIGDLRLFYTKSQLRDLSPKTRKIVADCLTEFAEEQHKQPLDVWITISANNGNFNRG